MLDLTGIECGEQAGLVYLGKRQEEINPWDDRKIAVWGVVKKIGKWYPGADEYELIFEPGALELAENTPGSFTRDSSRIDKERSYPISRMETQYNKLQLFGNREAFLEASKHLFSLRTEKYQPLTETRKWELFTEELGTFPKI